MEKSIYSSDTVALEAAGKKQVLRREWNFIAILAFSATSLSTWEAMSALFAGAYLNGGPASVVYGLIVSILGTLCIGASFAEMASISPIAGAQYHWTAEHAPAGWKSFMSYFQGWVTCTGWQAAIASVAFLFATMVQGVVIFNNENYVPQRWHATLIMIALGGFAVFWNTVGKKFLPIWETATGFFHVLFFFILFITLLATSKKAPNSAVWGTFINSGGWPNNGVSFCLGFLTPAFALAGVDAVVHMSEETHHANINIPRAMICSVIINGGAAFAYILALLYSITDVDTVLSTPTGYPVLQTFFEATNNAAAATAMMSAVIIVFAASLPAFYASGSRLIWAFARDNGLPYSHFFSHISRSNATPTRAVLLTWTITCLLSLINIGSTTAFNALLSLATLGLYFSYTIPIVMIAIRRFNKQNPIQFGPWNLGRYGLAINILAVLFSIFLIIFLPFPPQLPVTASNMNYASPVFIGVMAFAMVDYVVWGRKRYRGPISELDTEVPHGTGEVVESNEQVEEKAAI